jgi:hypothetical protein
VAAAFGHSTWKNTTSASATSPFEFGNVGAQATATLGTCCLSGCYLPESEDRQHRAVADGSNSPTATPTTTFTMNTGSPTSTSKQHLTGHVLCLPEAYNAAHFAGCTAQPYYSLTHLDKIPPEAVVTFTNLLLNYSLPNASSHPTLCLDESKVSPKATCLNFVLSDCTNVHIFIWPVLANASVTSSDNHPHDLASEINTLLPYVEICGLLAVVWEIGMFVHAKVYKRWNKRCRSSTQEYERLRPDREMLDS